MSLVAGAALLVSTASAAVAAAGPELWRVEWPNTDFSRSTVAFESIVSGFGDETGGRDRIPAIDNPRFGTIREANRFLTDDEPVITVEHGGVAKAYPLSIMLWHEIVNDEIAGMPIAVTFCPLCNSSVVFDRRLGDTVLDFGVTGKLRNSDLIMYDRQTESWWQQFTGEGIVGRLAGAELTILPVRTESFDSFRARFPGGQVMQLPQEFARRYGENPYRGYDSLDRPPLFFGPLVSALPPLAYVVAVGDQAWSLDLLRERRQIVTEDGLVIEWSPGKNSVLDTLDISLGRDVGNVTVRRRDGDRLVDVAHDTTFAFAFSAFFPQGVIYVR